MPATDTTQANESAMINKTQTKKTKKETQKKIKDFRKKQNTLKNGEDINGADLKKEQAPLKKQTKSKHKRLAKLAVILPSRFRAFSWGLLIAMFSILVIINLYDKDVIEYYGIHTLYILLFAISIMVPIAGRFLVKADKQD